MGAIFSRLTMSLFAGPQRHQDIAHVRRYPEETRQGDRHHQTGLAAASAVRHSGDPLKVSLRHGFTAICVSFVASKWLYLAGRRFGGLVVP